MKAKAAAMSGDRREALRVWARTLTPEAGSEGRLRAWVAVAFASDPREALRRWARTLTPQRNTPLYLRDWVAVAFASDPQDAATQEAWGKILPRYAEEMYQRLTSSDVKRRR